MLTSNCDQPPTSRRSVATADGPKSFKRRNSSVVRARTRRQWRRASGEGRGARGRGRARSQVAGWQRQSGNICLSLQMTSSKISRSPAPIPTRRARPSLSKMESERYYTELGIKINKLRISVRFPRWLRKAGMDTTNEQPREQNEGAEPYWEFRQVSKDGLFLVCTPITTCGAGESVASTSRTSTTQSLTSSSHLSGSGSSVCPPPPPVPPKSSPAALAVMKPVRPPYPSSTVSKRNERALKRSSYV